jgi:hypothetical protein
MNTQKIRCGKCGAVVAELDGDQLSFYFFHRRRRRSRPLGAGLQYSSNRPVTWGIDDADTMGIAKVGGDSAHCRGRCGLKYSLAELVATARKLRRTGRASAKVFTHDGMVQRNYTPPG